MTKYNLVFIIAMIIVLSANAFTISSTSAVRSKAQSSSERSTAALSAFGGGKKKKVKEDLSYIETRDMTKQEMLEYNRQSEDIMNGELIGMTVFSLIISAPLLYLACVGLFSETSEIAGGM